MDPQEAQILALEEEIRKTPYHKGTERHIGILRARIALLKDKVLESQSRKSGGGGGYAVKKQGDATIVLVGPPSAGKSTLLNALTNAESKVAPYAFTTVSVIPGMMKYRNAHIQILDVPGLIEGAEEGKGRGKEVISVIRGADLLVIMSDVFRAQAIVNMELALERNGIRVNKSPAKIRIEKRLNGGLFVQTNIRQDLDRETIKEVVMQMGVKNADIYIEQKIKIEDLVDAFSRNKVYIPALYVLNKKDLGIPKQLPPEFLKNLVMISADKEGGLDDLKEAMWAKLGFVTVYLVRPNEEPSNNDPVIMLTGSTLKEVALSVGTEFAEDKTRARIWGTGAKFPGQEVSLTEHVKDGMQIRFI